MPSSSGAASPKWLQVVRGCGKRGAGQCLEGHGKVLRGTPAKQVDAGSPAHEDRRLPTTAQAWGMQRSLTRQRCRAAPHRAAAGCRPGSLPAACGCGLQQQASCRLVSGVIAADTQPASENKDGSEPNDLYYVNANQTSCAPPEKKGLVTRNRRSPKRAANASGCQASRLPPASGTAAVAGCSFGGMTVQHLALTAAAIVAAAEARPPPPPPPELHIHSKPAKRPTCPVGRQASQQCWLAGAIKSGLKLFRAHAGCIRHTGDASATAAEGSIAAAAGKGRRRRRRRHKAAKVDVAAVPAPALWDKSRNSVAAASIAS